MNILKSMVAGLALVMGTTAVVVQAESSDVILRLRSAGARKILADTNAFRLNTMAGLPPSQELYQKIITKLAWHGPEMLAWSLPAKPGASTSALTPVLEDLWQGESYVLVLGREKARRTLVASLVPAARTAVWQQSLAQLAPGPGGQVQCVRHGDWTCLLSGTDAERAALEADFKKAGAPALKDGRFISVELDGDSFRELLPVPFTDSLARLDIGVSFRRGDVLIQGDLKYGKPMAWRVEPWLIPTNFIRDQVVGFSALNGARPWLEQNRLARSLQAQTLPNQIYGWAMSGGPFLTYAATPTAGGSNAVRQMATALPPLVLPDQGKVEVGNFLLNSNRAQVIWQGLPFVFPSVQCLLDGSQEYVVAGLMPFSPNSKRKPAAAELYRQVLGRTNLLYYHWELTGERLRNWWDFMQLAPLFTDIKSLNVNDVGQKWIQTVFTSLGNTVTEVTIASPTELQLVRKSTLGFTGFELNLLGRWLDTMDVPPSAFKNLHPRGGKPFRPMPPPPGK